MYPIANVRDKSTPSVTGKVGLELADTPEDKIDLDLFFNFLNRQVVSKEAGERGLHTNTYPNNRSSSKGRNESKKSAYTHISDRERVLTTSVLFSEARPALNYPSCTSDCFRFLAPNGIISRHDPMTKRSALSLASKMFDPMGLILPFTVRGKIFFKSCGGRDYSGMTH